VDILRGRCRSAAEVGPDVLSAGLGANGCCIWSITKDRSPFRGGLAISITKEYG